MFLCTYWVIFSCRNSFSFSGFSELFWFPPSVVEFPLMLTPICDCCCCCCCCIKLCWRSCGGCNCRSHWTWQWTWLSLQRSVVQLPPSSLTLLSSRWAFWLCPVGPLFWAFWWFGIWWWDCCCCCCCGACACCCCCCWCSCCCACACICCCICACAACRWLTLAGICAPSKLRPGRDTGI